MRVFVDTSGFYAVLDGSDPYHQRAVAAFQAAVAEGWSLETTNYVVQESWSLIQNRLGWDATDALLNRLLSRCKVYYVDATLHARGAARCRQARVRHLSLTDCVSFEYMHDAQIRYVIGQDDHFRRAGYVPR